MVDRGAEGSLPQWSGFVVLVPLPPRGAPNVEHPMEPGFFTGFLFATNFKYHILVLLLSVLLLTLETRSSREEEMDRRRLDALWDGMADFLLAVMGGGAETSDGDDDADDAAPAAAPGANAGTGEDASTKASRTPTSGARLYAHVLQAYKYVGILLVLASLVFCFLRPAVNLINLGNLGLLAVLLLALAHSGNSCIGHVCEACCCVPCCSNLCEPETAGDSGRGARGSRGAGGSAYAPLADSDGYGERKDEDDPFYTERDDESFDASVWSRCCRRIFDPEAASVVHVVWWTALIQSVVFCARYVFQFQGISSALIIPWYNQAFGGQLARVLPLRELGLQVYDTVPLAETADTTLSFVFAVLQVRAVALAKLNRVPHGRDSCGGGGGGSGGDDDWGHDGHDESATKAGNFATGVSFLAHAYAAFASALYFHSPKLTVAVLFCVGLRDVSAIGLVVTLLGLWVSAAYAPYARSLGTARARALAKITVEKRFASTATRFHRWHVSRSINVPALLNRAVAVASTATTSPLWRRAWHPALLAALLLATALYAYQFSAVRAVFACGSKNAAWIGLTCVEGVGTASNKTTYSAMFSFFAAPFAIIALASLQRCSMATEDEVVEAAMDCALDDALEDVLAEGDEDGFDDDGSASSGASKPLGRTRADRSIWGLGMVSSRHQLHKGGALTGSQRTRRLMRNSSSASVGSAGEAAAAAGRGVSEQKIAGAGGDKDVKVEAGDSETHKSEGARANDGATAPANATSDAHAAANAAANRAPSNGVGTPAWVTNAVTFWHKLFSAAGVYCNSYGTFDLTLLSVLVCACVHLNVLSVYYTALAGYAMYVGLPQAPSTSGAQEDDYGLDDDDFDANGDLGSAGGNLSSPLLGAVGGSPGRSSAPGSRTLAQRAHAESRDRAALHRTVWFVLRYSLCIGIALQYITTLRMYPTSGINASWDNATATLDNVSAGLARWLLVRGSSVKNIATDVITALLCALFAGARALREGQCAAEAETGTGDGAMWWLPISADDGDFMARTNRGSSNDIDDGDENQGNDGAGDKATAEDRSRNDNDSKKGNGDTTQARTSEAFALWDLLRYACFRNARYLTMVALFLTAVLVPTSDVARVLFLLLAMFFVINRCALCWMSAEDSAAMAGVGMQQQHAVNLYLLAVVNYYSFWYVIAVIAFQCPLIPAPTPCALNSALCLDPSALFGISKLYWVRFVFLCSCGFRSLIALCPPPPPPPPPLPLSPFPLSLSLTSAHAPVRPPTRSDANVSQ